MGKVSPKDGQSNTLKQKRRPKSTKNKYLRPGALAQLRNTKVSVAKCCTDLKKRVIVTNTDDAFKEVLFTNAVNDESPIFLSPVRSHLGDMTSHMDLAKQNYLQMTPKTPGAVEGMLESRLESLPLDLLVNILCHLQHDQLKAVFHVSQKIRKAVILARQIHFNYTTPDRRRQDMLGGTVTPLPTDHCPFASKGDGKGALDHSPLTPQAPKHGPKPPSRLKFIEMQQIAAVLFQESAIPSRHLVPSVIPKPLCKSLGSNRVLFYEDELCQAVSQNKLR